MTGAHGQIDAQRALGTSFGEQLASHAQRLEGISDQFNSHAKADEVRTIMSDVLVMWRSIKQLDVAKADKTVVDAFVTEIAATQEATTKRQDELSSECGGKMQEETLEMVRQELDSKFSNWEVMWGKMDALVEDLISKVEDLQNSKGGGSGKMPSTGETASTQSTM